MSGRPAPPGRRGSVKKEAFKADDETAAAVQPVVVSAADRQKAERDEEMRQAMALRKKAQEEEQAAAQREQEERKQAAARLRAEEMQRAKAESKAAEEAAQQKKAADDAELRRQEQERAQEAKRLAEAKRLEAQRAEEEARAAALAKEEQARAERARQQRAEEDARTAAAAREEQAGAERARAEREREAKEAAARQEEAERARAAKAEAARAAKEEAARLEAEMAEKLRLQQEQEDREFEAEQERQRKELDARRKAREAEEAQRQAEQEAFLKKQQEIEEQQRRMDEKLARQREQLAEAAARERAEQERVEAEQRAAAQERDRQRAEAAAARAAAEQAEIARLRAEEEERQRALLEAQRREEEAHQEEVRRLEAERAAAAEEARRAEAVMSEFESAALEEKRRRAEAQRKKREMFLNDLDAFSTTFEAKTSAQDERIKEDQDKHYELLAQQMKEVEAVKASVAAKEAREKEQRAAALAAAQAAAAAEAEAAARAAEQASIPPPAAVEPAPMQDEHAIRLGGADGTADRLGALTSSLFTSASSEPSVQSEDAPAPSGPVAMVLTGEEEGGAEQTAAGSDELRVPTRIGSGKAKTKAVPFKPAPASVIVAKAEAAIAKYSEDEEEEGTGDINSISNVLTLEERRKMTLAQKETWRAKQSDLNERRKDFHGVVTYTFDGVFSWQMYGSAEAVDESGSTYTEYLMRCQWGTNFENMQPWIVAHRYREFDQLDQALKRKFPRLEANMPKLPKKELFRALSSDVVAERRAVLEEYMSKIVASMPSLLRSELMNDFLDITNRISAIRLKLLKESNRRVAEAAAGGVPPPETVATPPPAPGVKSSAVPSNSKYGIEDPLSYSKFGAMTGGPEHAVAKASSPAPKAFAAEVEEEPLYWTLDDAEAARAAKQSHSLDEDALGHLETDIRALGVMLRKGDKMELLERNSRFRTKYAAVSKRWPNLRATAVVGMGVDFTLIPRAMQAEEDLLRYINEFRGMETAASLTGRMAAV